MDTFTLSIVLIITAGLFQGTFGLGMKKFMPLAWEAFWLIFSVLGMVVIPYLWASLTVPDVWAAISAVPLGTLLPAMFFGACWGVGAIMFGLAVNYVGMSIAYGISMGLAAAMGSLVPLAMTQGATSNPATPFILLGVAIMVAGVAVVSYAAICRDRVQAGEGTKIAGIKTGVLFRIGLLFAILNGVFAALLNIGFTIAAPLAEAAVAQGALARNASLVPWMVVLFGGFLVNLGYSVLLLIKNRTYSTYLTKNAAKGCIWAIATAALWFAALGVYGQGAAIMGNFGPVIGWTMFLGLSLVVSNAWGIGSGEWKNAKGPLKILIVGNVVLIVSWIILGYSNSLS